MHSFFPLPQDIIIEILCRLEVKDLLRFRCVSKPWCSVIDSHDFVKLQLSHSLKTNTHFSLLLLDFPSLGLYSLDFDSPKTATKLNCPLHLVNDSQILGSCNGLLAFKSGSKDELQITLWNPSTRKFWTLPAPEIEFPPPPRICACMIVQYGFGYDSASDDYKLVRMAQFQWTDKFLVSEVKVYSFKSNSWRRVKDFLFGHWNNCIHGVFVNNALHWEVTRNFYEPYPGRLLTAFDLSTEEYRELPKPCSFHQDSVILALGGCLGMIADDIEDLGNWKYDVWVMKEYGVNESWIKLFSVTKSSYNNRALYPSLVYSRCGNKVLLNCLQDNRLVWFDLRTKTFTHETVNNIPIGANSISVDSIYVGSLVGHHHVRRIQNSNL